jgi:chromosome segregation ATPase
MLRQIDSLRKDNEDLRLQLSQSQTLMRIQDDRINELLGNVSSLSSELEKARAEASGLRGEKTLLSAGLILATTVSLLLGFLEVRRRWRER